jgi:hypothetical protein
MEYLKNTYVRIAIIFVAGLVIGSLFKDTKTIETEVRKETSEKYEKQISILKTSLLKETSDHAEELLAERQSSKIFKETTDRKIDTLTTENSSLKQRIKKSKYKIVKPDGTIIEKEYEESDTEQTSSVITEIKEEFSRKVTSIENRWKKIHESRVSSIKKTHDEKVAILEKELKEKDTIESEVTKITTNKKKLRAELGYSSDKEEYGHITYSVWGPLFLGLHGTKDSIGVGIGIEL